MGNPARMRRLPLEDFLEEVYRLAGRYSIAGFAISVVRAEAEDEWTARAAARICPHPAFLPYEQMIYGKLLEYSNQAIKQEAESGRLAKEIEERESAPRRN
jgi:hypothetical protein